MGNYPMGATVAPCSDHGIRYLVHVDPSEATSKDADPLHMETGMGSWLVSASCFDECSRKKEQTHMNWNSLDEMSWDAMQTEKLRDGD